MIISFLFVKLSTNHKVRVQIIKIENEHLDKIFFSLSDTHRRFILSMLVSEDLKVSDIAIKSNLTLASTSEHLRVLHNCELIIKKRKVENEFVRQT